VALPEGVAINPSGGGGLEACTSEPAALTAGALGSPGDQIGYKGQEELNAEYEPGVKWNTFTPELASPLAPGTNFCPNGSKIGTVKIKTPLLEHEVEGAVYLATQDSNPFESVIAMYIFAEDPYSGSLIKLAGEVTLNPQTGQLSFIGKGGDVASAALAAAPTGIGGMPGGMLTLSSNGKTRRQESCGRWHQLTVAPTMMWWRE